MPYILQAPNFMHYEQTMLFLKAGKHVICEKSLASNYAEAEEMIRTACYEKMFCEI